MSFFAGYRAVEIDDSVTGQKILVPIMYPTEAEEKKESFGAFSIEVARDSAVTDGRFPLALISHGSGGHHLVYRTLAKFLVSNGFIVAMPEHPGNNRYDNSQEWTVENLVNRPRHISLVIDWLLHDSQFAPHVVAEQIFLIGHSMGGYTALAVAGGVPWSLPDTEPGMAPRPVEVVHDSRVKALVLLGPATPWFEQPDSLKNVHLPILMIIGNKDEFITNAVRGEFVSEGVPDKSKIEEWIVENGGHFSFLSMFPKSMNTISFRPAQDPPGFDRQAFHEQMHARILQFLRRYC